MPELRKSQTVSVAIGRRPDEVYAFVANPENLPQWARGLGASPHKDDGGWVIETPQGPARFRFAEPNTLGVLDHSVTVPSGVDVYVPMRVVANGDGSEVLFTLFQSPAMPDDRFAEDAALVERDLRTLKAVLERQSANDGGR